ncbi:MAG: hypothetical protein Q7U30_13785 [Methylicorpusculum sp.]|nr:hypothetical protein [Methylicorpusculum sp.]
MQLSKRYIGFFVNSVTAQKPNAKIKSQAVPFKTKLAQASGLLIWIARHFAVLTVAVQQPRKLNVKVNTTDRSVQSRSAGNSEMPVSGGLGVPLRPLGSAAYDRSYPCPCLRSSVVMALDGKIEAGFKKQT